MPSHNCIIISQCSVFKVHLWISLRDSVKHLISQVFQSISFKKWWAKMDSNHRPHDYQSCALASWAIGPYLVEIKSTTLAFKQKLKSSTCVFVSPLPTKPASLGFCGSPFGLTSSLGTSFAVPSKLNNAQISKHFSDLRTLQAKSSFSLKSP